LGFRPLWFLQEASKPAAATERVVMPTLFMKLRRVIEGGVIFTPVSLDLIS
jgi:hypothetical protein